LLAAVATRGPRRGRCPALLSSHSTSAAGHVPLGSCKLGAGLGSSRAGEVMHLSNCEWCTWLLHQHTVRLWGWELDVSSPSPASNGAAVPGHPADSALPGWEPGSSRTGRSAEAASGGLGVSAQLLQVRALRARVCKAKLSES